MKKNILGLALGLLLSSGLSAQNKIVRKDSVSIESNDKYKVVTNKFFNNWFIGVGGGAQIYLGDHDKQMKFGDRLTGYYSAQLGKWFTPGVGVRANFGFGEINGVTQTGPYIIPNSPYADKGGSGYWLSNEKFEYRHYSADVLFGLSNLFGGYSKNRFYNLNFYAGLGWMVNTTAEPKKVRDVSANVGFENEFRLSNAFDLALDIRGTMVDDRFDGDLGNRRQEGPLSAMLALKYNFKKRDWDKEKIITINVYDETELNDLRDRLNKLANDNDALKKQLAESSNPTITDIKVEKNYLAAPILVTFPINKSTVSNEARVNLGFFAKLIKEGKSNVVYNIAGYADKGTGSVKTNERLSIERAEAIYNVLVREFGVSTSQLTISHHGGVDNMFYDDPRVSRAVIVMGN